MSLKPKKTAHPALTTVQAVIGTADTMTRTALGLRLALREDRSCQKHTSALREMYRHLGEQIAKLDGLP